MQFRSIIGSRPANIRAGIVGGMSIVVMAASASGATLRVDPAAPNSPHDGSSWPNAFLTIEAAVNAAAANDIIWVAGGTYNPAGGQGSSFALKREVSIQGGLAGYGASNPDERNTVLYETILSGDISNNDGANFTNRSDNVYQVVVVPANCIPRGSPPYIGASSANLDGFTIEGGYAVDTNAFEGAGVYIDTEGSCVIRDCRITDNYSLNFAGGIKIEAESHAVLRNCLIDGNHTETYGGGMFYKGLGSLKVLNCTFQSNTAKWGGGAIAGAGGQGGSATLTDCYIISSTFDGNMSHHAGQNDGEGGALWFLNTSTAPVQIYNCVLTNNEADHRGGGMYAKYFNMINGTVADNAVTNSTGSGGGIAKDGSGVISNSILWDNSATNGAQYHVVSGSSAIAYSNVEGNGTSGSNIDQQPIFDTDYRLVCNSPGINVGDDNAIEDDDEDVNENGMVSEDVPDRDFNTRKLLTVDMGAFETQVVATCAADVAPTPCRDSAVNVVDLLAVIIHWGTCPAAPAYCEGNVNLDGTVNVTDLLAVITAWGPCGSPDGAPQSVDDCEDTCAGQFGTGTPDYFDCVEKCVRALCETGALPPEDCP